MSDLNNTMYPFSNQYSAKPIRNYLTEDDHFMLNLEPGEERKQTQHVRYFVYHYSRAQLSL